MEGHAPAPSPVPFSIVINIQVPAGNGIPSISSSTSPAPPTPQAPDPQPSPPKALDSMTVPDLLALCRVVRPAEILEQFNPDQIRRACKAGLSRPRRNLGGWVSTALRKGWKL